MERIQEVTLTKVDGTENNNKYWKGHVEEQNGSYVVVTEWGRVGADNPQHKAYPFSDLHSATKKLDSKISEKQGKGYRKLSVLQENVTVKTSTNDVSLADVAMNQIDFDKSKKELRDLIKTLVSVNVHQIMDFKYDIKITNQGMITTALGVVSAEAIQEAKESLDALMSLVTRHGDLWGTKEVLALNEKYYGRIPKKYRKIEDVLLKTKEDIQNAYQFCDQLEQTALFYENSKKAEIAKKINGDDATKNANAPKVFDTQIAMLDPKDKDFVRIVKKFNDEKNSQHGGRINRCKVKNIYTITIRQSKDAFDKCKVGNINEYWHGTKASNVLSILKGGMRLPKSLSSSVITGAMFDGGLYFSDQSTKSLQYSFGYAPGQASTNLNVFFMFLSDVRMGKEHTPTGPNSSMAKIVKQHGCDSCFAKAGKSGVRNNEMIVYSIDQANLTYLIEFEEK